MTERIKSAIDHYRDVCVQMGQYPESDTYRYAELAIRSLHAWGEVLTELEETKEHATDLVRPKIFGRKLKELTDMCFDEAIDIINQKLSEIEE